MADIATQVTVTRCPICEGSGVVGNEREVLAKIVEAFNKHGGAMSVDEVIEQLQRTDAARLIGRLGGMKGGRARAAKLSPERRSEIARVAASARWSRKSSKQGGGV